jgi:16S rRNA (cytidine1402-2'-O)-methyltransferase
LEDADVLACEDTSVGARLLAANGIRRSIARLDEHAPVSKLRSIVEEAAAGKSVVYFSDAGTPGVSDPGPALVDLAHEAGVEVDAIPGPSAVFTAVMLSGFFAQKLVFLGFLSRKAGAIASELQPYAESTTTLVFFEAPTRMQKTLEIALKTLGERRVAVCREMTKAHQEVVRCSLSELVLAGRTFKGECTVVLEGRRKSLARGS